MNSAPAPETTGEQQQQQHCAECPSGTGVVRLCSSSSKKEQHSHNATALENTLCEPCVSGVTFSDSPSRHLPCRACRTCPPNSRVKRECNATHDAECECERDHYQEMSYQQTALEAQEEGVDGQTDPAAAVAAGTDDGATTPPHARHKHGLQVQVQPSVQLVMSCNACDLCPHGYGAARPCSPTHNTICRKCPTSTYSSVLSATHGCSVCTVCRDDQVTLHECTPIQDTVCAGKVGGSFRCSPLCVCVIRNRDRRY